MKIRQDLVTNSSASVFILINKSNENKTLIDFITENPINQEHFNDMCDESDEKYLKENVLKNIETYIIKKNKINTFDIQDPYSYNDKCASIIIHSVEKQNGSSETFIWGHIDI